MARSPRELLCAVPIAFLLLSAVPLTAYGLSTGESATTVLGQSDFTSGAPSTSATGLNSSRQFGFDSKGDLWVADGGNNRVLEFTAPFSNGEAASIVIGQSSFTSDAAATTATGLDDPHGIAFDSAGDLWVSDMGDNRVLEFLPPFSTGEAASLVLGQTTLTSSSAATTSIGLYGPRGLAFDSKGDLWVADETNSRVLEFTPPFSSGEAASLVLGQSSFTTGVASTTATGLHNEHGLGFDSKGDLWVVDQGNNRVLEFTPPFSNGEAASLVLGQDSFTAGAAATTATGLDSPRAIAFDSSGDAWVADATNNRVVEFTAPFSTGEAASTVLGQTGMNSAYAAATAQGLDSPRAVAFDSSGNLWVIDEGNNRILEYAASESTTSSTQTSSGTSTTTASSSTSSVSTTNSVQTSTTTSTTTTTTTASASSTSTGTTSTSLTAPEFPSFAVAFTMAGILAVSAIAVSRVGKHPREADPAETHSILK